MAVALGIEGLRVGHFTDRAAHTGCTVILPPAGNVASVFVAGGAPATHETDLLAPGMKIAEVHAILLTGGSAFGLAAAGGVMRWLEDKGTGYQTPIAVVPIVPAAGIFDLWPGDPTRRPTAEDATAACEAAADQTEEGNVGAGTGATVGKHRGPAGAVKGGLGYGLVSDGDLRVGAFAVVNAVGDVYDDGGHVIAGSRLAPGSANPWSAPATTLCCVVTNAALSKEQIHRVARSGSSGLARAVRPAATMSDGDAVFAVATGEIEASVDAVGALAADAVATAIRRAVLAAESIPDVPACTAPDGAPFAG